MVNTAAEQRSHESRAPSGRPALRVRGINYDTGFTGDGHASRSIFDPGLVRQEMGVIADDLHCTAVRVSGGDLDRLAVAGRAALEAGLELWFAPFPTELTPSELTRCLTDAAERAAVLDRAFPGRVVLVMGCEISLFNAGFLPGETFTERATNLMTWPWSDEQMAAFRGLSAALDGFFTGALAAVRKKFHGRVSYASGTWETLDWTPFDIVGIDGYRDAQNAATYRQQLRTYLATGKPVAVTEFGCCTYRGAADRGGMGWAIVDRNQTPARLDGPYERSEDEQVDYLRELLEIFADEQVDAAFWFTFAGYELPHRADPLFDLDMASYGVVKLHDPDADPPGTGLGWEPKKVFRGPGGCLREGDVMEWIGLLAGATLIVTANLHGVGFAVGAIAGAVLVLGQSRGRRPIAVTPGLREHS